MPTQRDIIGAAILGGAFLLILLTAELWARLGKPKPEWTRKLVHVGGGVACLFFPFLVRSPWVVLAMSLAMSGLFVVGARTKLLPSLHRVARRTFGAELYPIAIFITYALSYAAGPWLFVSSVLVLAVADTSAALIGGRYGRVRYQVEQETKSLEGSLAFLVIAFLALHLPALLMSDAPRANCVLAALLVAALVTGFEAISIRGTDNLFVPVAACVAMGRLIEQPVETVIFQGVSLLGLCALIGVLSRRLRTFNTGGTITLMLFAYVAWALGSWLWAMPILISFVLYVLLEMIMPVSPEQTPLVRVRTLARALLPLLVLVVAAYAYDCRSLLFAPYIAACSTVLGFALWTYVRHLRGPRGWRRWLGAVAAQRGGWPAARSSRCRRQPLWSSERRWSTSCSPRVSRSASLGPSGRPASSC